MAIGVMVMVACAVRDCGGSALELGLRRAQPATRRAIARVLGVWVGEIAW